jgi:hypothetical protein
MQALSRLPGWRKSAAALAGAAAFSCGEGGSNDAHAGLDDAGGSADAAVPGPEGSTPTDASGPNPGPDGSADARADADASEECNAVVQQATAVGELSSTAPAPAAAGGLVVDGTYVLTKSTVHTGALPDGSMVSSPTLNTAVIAGGTWREISQDPGGRFVRVNIAFTTTGTAFASAYTCWYPPLDAGFAAETLQYTATTTELVLIQAMMEGWTRVTVWTRQ